MNDFDDFDIGPQSDEFIPEWDDSDLGQLDLLDLADGDFEEYEDEDDEYDNLATDWESFDWDND